MDDDKLLNEVFEHMRINMPESPNRNTIRAEFLVQVQGLKQQAPASRSGQQYRWMQRISHRMDFTIDRKWTPVVTVLVLISLVVGMIFAQQIFDIFTQIETDDHTIPVMYGVDGRQDINRPISIEEAVEKVDFTISLPGYIPEAYQYAGIYYWDDEERLTIHYQCDSFRQLIISQKSMSLDEMADLENQGLGLLDVGASANIELIQINGVEGQYVRGAWIVMGGPDIQFAEVDGKWTRIYNDNGEVSTLVPGSHILTQGEWQNESEFQRLFWYYDGILYIISNIGSRIDVGTAGECTLNKAIYEAVARRLMPIDAVK